MVRRAVSDDAEAIGRIAVEAWREAYAHILPAGVLANQDAIRRASRVRERIEGGTEFWVAERDGEVVGFASVGPNRYPDLAADGELNAIYVAPSAYRLGIGTDLVRASANSLFEQGFTAMCVLCFRDNARVRSFYESLGAEFQDASTVEIEGESYPDVRYLWPSLSALVQRLSRTRPSEEQGDHDPGANDAGDKGGDLNDSG